MATLLIVGCGDIGRRILKQTTAVEAIATTRTTASADAARALGAEVLTLDLDQPRGLEQVTPAGATVFYLAPPAAGDTGDGRVRRFLRRCEHARPRSIVYLSTSGVYGDCRGAWVDESRHPNPATARARRRLDAERLLRDFASRHGVALSILRVGGIYAPDRLPVERLRRGITVVCPEQAPYTNRIHADDLATACVAAARVNQCIRIYNAADGHPGTMADYFYRAADYLGLPRPPCVPLSQAASHLSPAMLSYLRESRRLDVTRLRRELELTFAFPDLASGLPLTAPPGAAHTHVTT